MREIDVDRRLSRRKWTLLHAAAYGGHSGVVRRLLDRGDVDLEATVGGFVQTALWYPLISCTPLQLAVAQGSLKIDAITNNDGVCE